MARSHQGCSNGFLASSYGILFDPKQNTTAIAAAITSLTIQAVSMGLLTSPTGGGPGNISGTLYFGSWLGFMLSFELCLRYLELFSTGSRGAGGKGGNVSSRGITLFKDVFADKEEGDDSAAIKEEGEHQSVLKLCNGSDGRSGRSSKCPCACTYYITAKASDMEEGIHKQSFVFSYAVGESIGGRPIRRRLPKQTSQVTGGRMDCPPSAVHSSDIDPKPTDYEMLVSRGLRGSRGSCGSRGSRESRDLRDPSREMVSRGSQDPSGGSCPKPALRNSTGSNPVGSIDVRSATQRSSSSTELNKNMRFNKFFAEDAEVNEDMGDEYPDGEDMTNSAFFRKGSGGGQGDKLIAPKPSFTNFNMNHVEGL